MPDVALGFVLCVGAGTFLFITCAGIIPELVSTAAAAAGGSRTPLSGTDIVIADASGGQRAADHLHLCGGLPPLPRDRFNVPRPLTEAAAI